MEVRLLSDSGFAGEFDLTVTELIDEYVAGKFEGERLARLENHLVKAPERQSQVAFARALQTAGNRKNLHIKRSWLPVYTRYVAFAAAIVVAVFVGLWVWQRLSAERNLTKGLLALHAAYREQRPVEARLVGFSYAPAPNQRGQSNKVDYVQHDLAASLLIKQASDHPDARSHQALGQLYLSERKFAEAIDQFQKAVTSAPDDARIHSDFAAAWLEKALTSRDSTASEDLNRCLDQANQASRLDVNLPEAVFNQALCQEYLSNREQAIREWEKLLQLEPNSPWSIEATQHLQSLRK